MIAFPRKSRRVVGLLALIAALPAVAQQQPRPLDLQAPAQAPAIQLEPRPLQTQPATPGQTAPTAPRQAQPVPAQRPAVQPPTQPVPPAQPQQRRPATAAPASSPALPTELPPAGASFVVVDGQRAIGQSTAGQGLRQQAEKQRTALRAEVQKQEAELKAAEQELQRQRPVLAQDAFDQKVREFQKRVQEAQTRIQTRTRNLDKGLAEAEQKITQAMLQIVGEIAQERRYAMIVDRGAVVVFAGQLEITQEVITRVNRKLPSVTLQVATN